MLQNKLSRWTIQSMRWIGVAILITGIASLVFGIVLLAAANTAHDEEVKQLEMELQPTTIGELKDLRETIRDNRHALVEPAEVYDFVQSIPVPLPAANPMIIPFISKVMANMPKTLANGRHGTVCYYRKRGFLWPWKSWVPLRWLHMQVSEPLSSVLDS